MATITYEHVTKVISKPPDQRKDFAIKNLIPWFRKKSKIFATLKQGE